MKTTAISCAMAFFLCLWPAYLPAKADPIEQTKGSFVDKFRQLEESLPTPNDVRGPGGYPGPRYWQQKVDYVMEARLDEAARRLTGKATITYRNNSPDTLPYLWLLLDQNKNKPSSISERTRTSAEANRLSYTDVRRAVRQQSWVSGFDLGAVQEVGGRTLKATVVDTLLRVDLAQPLRPGQSITFTLSWGYNLPETRVIGDRGGYECFEKSDGNCIFLMAQWFPRLAAYSDYEGWHNKAFLGSGEFTLEFGDYDVSISVPNDHVVSSTGTLQNEAEILSAAQRARLAQARASTTKPVYIVTPQEAEENEKSPATGVKTWRFKASNVRDFAFASSRKFIWDAMSVRQNDPQATQKNVLAMSFFPKEGDPLWSAYSTKSIAHTINVYSRFSVPYPYPTAQSVNGPVGGMEYPMITFNGPRPERDDKGNLTYTDRQKYGLISVIIHEVGHIYFPMTINSDERQWTWLDEGINTFLQYLAEQEWEKNYPSRRGDPRDIVEYMLSTNQVPIMTQSDSILQFGDNSYSKPATALVILRETILGRELFDFAFRQYAQSWAFKRPTPADFFRIMEEASGVDLDWFWRGWFYSTDHVDIALDDVSEARLNTQNPEIESKVRREARDALPEELTPKRNREEGRTLFSDNDPSVLDFYSKTDPLTPTKREIERYQADQKKLDVDEREALGVTQNFYRLTFSNRGGVVMPVIVKLSYADKTEEIVRIPAEIWRYNPKRAIWTWVTLKTLVQAEVDPLQETADANRDNNYFPQRIEPSRLEVFKAQAGRNQMRDLDLKVRQDSLETAPIEAEKPPVAPKD
jgi:Peptidase family M1 domain